MQLELAPEANADINEAVAWYFEADQDLGVRFAIEVRRMINHIAEYPDASTEIKPGIRRAVLHRFPYSVFYAVGDELIEVFAVVHQHRDPARWRKRR